MLSFKYLRHFFIKAKRLNSKLVRNGTFSNFLLITDIFYFFQAIASSFLFECSTHYRLFYFFSGNSVIIPSIVIDQVFPNFLLNSDISTFFSGNSVIVPSIVINPACTAEEIPYISLDEFLSPDSDENSSLIRQEGKNKQKPTFSLVALLVDVTYL